MSGLMIDGRLVPVPGYEIISPDETPWAHLSKEDGAPRGGRKPQQKILHKTIADDPEVVLAGRGPHGGDEEIARMWARDPRSSAAQLVTSCDARTVCLVDLARMAAWHDGNYRSNLMAYGHEMKEVRGGGVYQATLDACLEITLVDTSNIGIQWQCPIRYVDNRPLRRFENGGRDLIGIFGHRDVSDSRNRWDPGDEIFEMLRRRGVEAFDFAAREDIDVWGARQEWLAELGYYKGGIDGVPGPMTTAALKQAGFPGGIWARALEAVDVLPHKPAGMR